MEEYNIVNMVKIDNEAPNFELPFYDPKTDTDANLDSIDLNGKWSVLFFYPADFTFVCPTELKDMANNEKIFNKIWVEILTVSTDTVFSHRAWVKHEKLMKDFPYKMISDHALELSSIYNVLDDETGIAARCTVIIDPDGIIRWLEINSGPLWRNSDELIRKIEALQFMRKNPTMACPARWTPWEKALKPSIKIAWEVYEALND